MRADEKTKRRRLIKALGITASIFSALLLLLGFLCLVMSFLKRGNKKVDFAEKAEGTEFFSADYSADPLCCSGYAEMDRDVFFTDSSGFGEYLTEEDGASDDARGLIYNYFDALKSGDAAKHASLLSDDYKRNFAVQEKFTPQKLYDIKAEFLTGGHEGSKYVEAYRVSYGIYNNDGTFRADVGSGTVNVTVFKVAIYEKKALLDSIAPLCSKGG